MIEDRMMGKVFIILSSIILWKNLLWFVNRFTPAAGAGQITRSCIAPGFSQYFAAP